MKTGISKVAVVAAVMALSFFAVRQAAFSCGSCEPDHKAVVNDLQTKGLIKIHWDGSVEIPQMILNAAAAVNVDDTAIRDTINLHFAGIQEADVKKLETAWQADIARVNFIEGDENGKEILKSSEAKNVFKLWTEKADKTAKGEILSVDVTNDLMASAKVEFTWRGETFVDYLTLFNINGEWKIVNKGFTTKVKLEKPVKGGGYGQ